MTRWRPAGFTAPLRSRDRWPPLERWEAVLHAERSAGYRLAKAGSASPILRRVLRLASHPEDAWPALEEREALVADVRRSRLGRLVPEARRPEPGAEPQEGRPSPGPLLDREIDAALELLASVPFEELQERGWHLQPNHFYWPLNDLGFLRHHPELWPRARPLSGIEMDLEGQEALVRRLAAHSHELHGVRQQAPREPGEFVWENVTFPPLDACLYYGILRELRPYRVIEIGAGWSSLLLARAVAANPGATEVTLIDPSPEPQVLGELPAGWRMVPSLVQEAPLDLFEGLEGGDVLFYDGSHCVHTASDVNWVFFEVLPRLAPGVWIHIHDIHWPNDYPPGWVLDEGLSWNEQYLLEAFLTNNDSYRVRLSAALMLTERGPLMQDLFAGRLPGASVWIEKTG